MPPTKIDKSWKRSAPKAPGLEALRPVFEPHEPGGGVLGNPLFELLTAVSQGGSIRHAARLLGCSYRHAWGNLRRWEAVLGQPLISWSQGRRARPTAFAEKLLWAERRARVRMQPHFEALRCELARVLAEARDERYQLLSVRASHDLALPLLQQQLAAASQLYLDVGFLGSADALRALNERSCLIAGFHVPALRCNAPVFATALKRLLKPAEQKLIAFSRRTQGLMVRAEHATIIKSFPDIAQFRLRFVNRQAGSGTRMLVDHLVQEHRIEPASLRGYFEHIEHTHLAVALCVASGVVDAGVGVEAAALQFGLHFVPVIEENYFLACSSRNLELPAVERLRDFLAGRGWRAVLAGLPGYELPSAPGALLAMDEALPWWPRTAK